MSGDVQPRKRKDKKRKKDELGVEEHRGTAAVLGEGDVFMHSQHEHGTGGHWCAKIIFFSLLAVLITLIGLIILENRGLTELEANSVESKYSGVLDGWIEDAPDDDHHDEHTLELLKHHNEEDEHVQENDVSEEDHDDDHDLQEEEEHDDDDEHENDDDERESDEHDEEDDNDDDDDDDEREADEHDEEDDNDDDDDDESELEQEDKNEEDIDEAEQEISLEDQQQESDEIDDDEEQSQQDVEESEEQDLKNTEEDDENNDVSENNNSENDDSYEENDRNNDITEVDESDNSDDDFQNDQESDRSDENVYDDNSRDDDANDIEEQEEHEEEGNADVEVEKLEKEVSDEDQPSKEVEEKNETEEVSELPIDDSDDVDSVEDEEFLEAHDVDEPLPVVERLVIPKGKPLVEVEDEPANVKPTDTLAEEEEYEKRQEELRREEAQASHVWLKLVVGGALLVATHAVLSRAVAPRDDTPASEDHDSREDTPSIIDRRMTLLPQELAGTATPGDIIEDVGSLIHENVYEKESHISQYNKSFSPQENEEEEIEEEEIISNIKDITLPPTVETENKELYSDEDEMEEDKVEDIEDDVPHPIAHIFKKDSPTTEIVDKAVEPETDDLPDDVELIDDEQLEEELEEEEVEEEISDVDDAELLSRLEAKYGRLPEPERPGQKHKDGGNSIEDEWPGEPSDKYWRQQLDEAEEELGQGSWSSASERLSAPQLKSSARARWLLARAIDASAEAQRDNRLLTRAITAYLDVLKLNERLSDKKLIEIADRTLDRIRFRGNYLSAEPVYRLLIRRFPNFIDHRNKLAVSLLMANRADLAEEVIKETLQKWPDDRIALAHLGFILKTEHNRLEEAVEALQKALEGDTGPATEPRFYYHLGDAYLLLGRFDEAHEVHKRGARLGHFLSPSQRSLYNVDRLKSKPWWNIEQTPYIKLARALEKSWKEILKEGRAAQALYEKEKEGLKERGEWSQLDLFIRGQEVPGRCKNAPVTCSIVRTETAAAGCRRGQVKFSSMVAGTHVRPHVGPTNCRLRMHLGLSNTKDTYIRVDQEIRQWQVGKVLMFDDSFEHEVWHNGTGARLVLIVDVWHPALTAHERRSLPPI